MISSSRSLPTLSACLATDSDIPMIIVGLCMYHPPLIWFFHMPIHSFILLFLCNIFFISYGYWTGYLKHHIHHKSIKIYITNVTIMYMSLQLKCIYYDRSFIISRSILLLSLAWSMLKDTLLLKTSSMAKDACYVL